MRRKVFFVSDSTGVTAESLGRSLLVQFVGVEFECVTRPYIDTVEKAQSLAETINEISRAEGVRPLVIDTIIDREINTIIAAANSFKIDVFSTFLGPLEQELQIQPSQEVGHPAVSQRKDGYMQRIESVHFALDNDDGARTHRYDQADIILIGVSRSGKTPTCIYLGLQFGIQAANYPLTEEDFGQHDLPRALRNHRDKLFGLTIEPGRLSAIRQERRANSQYSALTTCQNEIRLAESLYKQFNIPYINTTHFSVEEISTKMLEKAGIERRVSSR